MSRQEQATYGKAISDLQYLRGGEPAGRIFFICAHYAWDWALRPGNSWFAWDGNAMKWAGPTDRQQRFYDHLLVLVNDFDQVTSIVYRLEWFRKRFRENPEFMTADDLTTFLVTDVHAFHAEFRSLMDTLCHVINLASSKPGQVPTDSFRALRRWCIETPKRANSILSEDLTKLIAEAYWFIEIRDLRDRIIHKQSDALVRLMGPEEHEVAFFTLKGQANERYEGPNAFQYNGWIYFRAHAGYYLGRLIHLLNEVCAMAADKLGISLVDMHWSTNRLPTVNGCIDYSIASLQSGFPLSEELRREHPEKTEHSACSQHDKIATRAYYLWLAGKIQSASEESYWLAAEAQQLRWLDP